MGWSVTNKDIPEVFQMWSDVYKFQKKYYNAPAATEETESDTFWKAAIAEADSIALKYKTKLCEAVLLGILDDIGERGKKHQ